MQVDPNLLTRFSRLQRTSDQLRGQFGAFQKQAARLHLPGGPLGGISITDINAEPPPSFDATFATVRVRFRYALVQSDSGSLSGKVVATLESPLIGDANPKVLDAFKFDKDGITDVEMDGSRLNIEYHAYEIVAHSLEAALRAPFP